MATRLLAVDEEHHTTNELIELMHSKLTPKAGDEIMSLAEILKEEGRFEEKINTAKRMLADGVDPACVAKATQLPLEQVKKLKTK